MTLGSLHNFLISAISYLLWMFQMTTADSLCLICDFPLDIKQTNFNSMWTEFAAAIAVLTKTVRKSHKIEWTYYQELVTKVNYSMNRKI